MAQNSISLSSPHLTSPESSLAYSPPTMAAKHLNLPPVPSATRIIQLANKDTTLFILQSILKTGAHLLSGKWVTLFKLLWDSPQNPGPFYHVYREWTASGCSWNIRVLVKALLHHYGEFDTLKNPYPSTIQALARRLSSKAAVATLEDRQHCDANTCCVEVTSLENDYQESGLGLAPRRVRHQCTACAWRTSLVSARAPGRERNFGSESVVHQLALLSCGARRSSSLPPCITELREGEEEQLLRVDLVVGVAGEDGDPHSHPRRQHS
jgi:hypothetical protein